MRHHKVVTEASPASNLSLRWLLPGYALMVSGLVFVTSAPLPQRLEVGLHFALIALAAWCFEAACSRLGKRGQALRPLAAGVLLLLTYSALGRALPWLMPEDREWYLMAFDRQYLGYLWEDWWGPFLHAGFTDLLALVYGSFYLMPFVYGLCLARSGDWLGLQQGPDRLLAGFLLSFCGYLLCAARSPYGFEAFALELPTYGIFPAIHTTLVETSWTKRDCVPSGHTMMSLYLAWFSAHRSPKFARVAIPWALLTVVATLYLRYHYLIDVLLGILACGIWIVLSERFFGRLKELQKPHQASLESTT
ncbi:MAG: phosphatase PAP2 family protein [Planctomycetes bacterium]|nr:phosphatase PAP2 family protein [Planctomycetota bacterium]